MSMHPDDRRDPAVGYDDPAMRTMPDIRGDRDRDPYDRDDHDRDGEDRSSSVDEVVQTLSQSDNRAKLLLAIAVMSALTLILALVIAIDHLTDGGAEPVLVDGVPCLVEQGIDDQAVLYCQR
jgi:hypothetical protein